MTLAAVKEKLHGYIEQADEKKVKTIYTLLEQEIDTKYTYDDDTVNLLEERREKFQAGYHKGFFSREFCKIY